jgi:hypothetical protein
MPLGFVGAATSPGFVRHKIFREELESVADDQLLWW